MPLALPNAFCSFVASRLCSLTPQEVHLLKLSRHSIGHHSIGHTRKISWQQLVLPPPKEILIVGHVFSLWVAIRHNGPQVKVKCIFQDEIRLRTVFPLKEDVSQFSQQNITTTLQDFWRTNWCCLCWVKNAWKWFGSLSFGTCGSSFCLMLGYFAWSYRFYLVAIFFNKTWHHFFKTTKSQRA